MKRILLFIILLGLSSHAQVKIGDNPTSVGASSLLELESTNKTLVLPRVANTAAIANPVEGMIVFDLSEHCFKGYQNGEWTACGFMPSIVNSILAQIGLEGDNPNTIPSVVTAGQLQQLPVTGVNPAYETLYQDYIDNNPNLFSSPATVSEVQAMITTVNASVTSILAQIGNEGDSPDVVDSVVTVSQLQQLPLTGINPANETAYQDYIDANPNLFSTPATVSEVQAMITTVNASVTSILAQIGNEGDSPDVVDSVVTVSQLQQLPLTGINPANETAYQDYIDANPNLFSTPATVSEVQAMITTVNTTPNISGLTCGTAVFSPAAMPSGALYSGTFTVPYTGGNGLAYPAGTGITSTGVTGLTATLQAGTLANGAGSLTYNVSGTPSAPGTASFAVTFGTKNCTVTKAVTLPALPANITLGAVGPYTIASAYDQDYLPFTAPTGPATLDTNQAADNSNEAITLDIQGTLTTTGVTINIPYTVVTASVSLPAYSQTINIPAAYTNDGIARDITFSYPSGTKSVGSGTIDATLKAEVGALNVKKLDLQSGLGNDFLGFLLGQFTYSTNSSGGTANFNVRAIACIPDRNIADANHKMFYVPIVSVTGRIWLNNNLGANYSNSAKAAFNPAKQATDHYDYHAYGSFFQWGRKADGHELVNWSSSSVGTLTATTTTKADVPGNSLFITTSAAPNDWRVTPDNNLWNGVAAVNNPCPIGFRVPTGAEFLAEVTAYGMVSVIPASNSILKLPATGRRLSDGVHNFSIYTYINLSDTDRIYFFTPGPGTAPGLARADGAIVRCIKN